MSKYHITICPACGRGKLKSVRWSNGSSCDADKYLDQDLYLICDGCNDKELIFNLYFKCDYHDEFIKINRYGLRKCLSSLCASSSMTEDILDEMIDKTLHYSY